MVIILIQHENELNFKVRMDTLNHFGENLPTLPKVQQFATN